VRLQGLFASRACQKAQCRSRPVRPAHSHASAGADGDL